MNRNLILLIATSGLLVIALLVLPWSTGPLGKGDFIGYWSASRLLLEGQDPYDATALLAVQQQAYPERGYLIYTWNPPWLLVLLLPMAALPFQVATRVWLLGNLGVLLLTSLWLWRLIAPADGRHFWVAGLAGVLFPPSLAAIGAGQIVPWVLLATVALLIWQRRAIYLGWAGALLPIVLLKPQVTFLAAAVSAWRAMRRRQWLLLFGGVLSVAALLGVATLFYSGWAESYLRNLGGRGVTQWQTPTLGGWLMWLWPIDWLRYLGLLVLASVPLLDRQRDDVQVLVSTLALGAATAPFGWSFDQILLLPLVLKLAAVNLKQPRWWSILGLAGLYVPPLIMRLMQVDEFNYVWVPWLALLLYWLERRRCWPATS